MNRHLHASVKAIAAGALALAALLVFAALKPRPTAADAQPEAPAQAPPATVPLTGKPMVLERSIPAIVAERIARQVIAASPIADPADPKARDAAGERLAALNDLLEAAPGKVLWGGFNPDQGYNPRAYRLNETSPIDYFQLTEFGPEIWAKLYLSMFMFTGEYQIKELDGVTVLSLGTQFRATLDPGDYPYPFWHSPNKWTAYINTHSVLMIFDDDARLVASMRRAPVPEALRLEKRKWDAKWTWTDEKGNPQPRVALFTYLFSPDNPHIPALDTSFRALEESFRAQNCMTCHSPDNRGRINNLLLLNYPNQALVMRRSLVTILEENQMPPGSATAGVPTGIQDKHTLAEMVGLAKDFEKHADAAFAHEQSRAAPATP